MMRGALELEGRLSIVDPHRQELALVASGSRITLNFPTVDAARDALRAVDDRRTRTHLLHLLHDVVVQGGLELVFAVRGRTVGRLAADTHARLASGVLGVGEVEVRMRDLFRALLGGRRP